MKPHDIKEDKSLWERMNIEGVGKVLLVEESYYDGIVELIEKLKEWSSPDSVVIPVDTYYRMSMAEELLRNLEENGVKELEVYKKADAEIFGCEMEDE
ncbi:hypothetical protein [Bacillus mycoides]|uniref:hypothetical protein n=1 Tax=Bacillus mycoides TaxID=1405 RepID=UPI001C032632|nr:hypothetical protein [Bacillus mycoides]QWI52498.1 hypothetical protein EXW56_26920 [Bacillus mycoides]